MKYIVLFLLSNFLILKIFAQQSVKADDALLLEYYQNQRFTDAADYLKKTYPEPVNNVKVLSQLAYTSQMAGRLSDAEGFYKRIYDKDSTNQTVLFNIAVINDRKGNILKAEAYYKKIVLKDSTNFTVYKQLAQISLKKSDLISQINYLQKANKLNPQEPDVAADLSNRYIQLKQLPQAEKVLNLAIIADPENVILLQSLLKLCSAQKKWPETIKTGEQLLQLGDNTYQTTTLLGSAYYEAKNYLCGIETLLALPEIYQTENSCYFTAGCYKQLKDQKSAIFYFNKAITLSLSPNIDNYYNEIADSYEQIKQFKKAQLAYQKSLQFEENPITLYFLANLYDAELKNKKNALKYFKKYLSANPPKKQQQYITYSKSRVTLLAK